MTKPPIVNFAPFHPSRVEPLRRWREKDLAEVPKKTRIKLDGTDGKPSSPKRPKKDKDAEVLALLPKGLDAKTQQMILEALRKK